MAISQFVFSLLMLHVLAACLFHLVNRSSGNRQVVQFLKQARSTPREENPFISWRSLLTPNRITTAPAFPCRAGFHFKTRNSYPFRQCCSLHSLQGYTSLTPPTQRFLFRSNQAYFFHLKRQTVKSKKESQFSRSPPVPTFWKNARTRQVSRNSLTR